jgi:hypothetical protein
MVVHWFNPVTSSTFVHDVEARWQRLQKLTRQEVYLYPSLPLRVRQMNSALQAISKDQV